MPDIVHLGRHTDLFNHLLGVFISHPLEAIRVTQAKIFTGVAVAIVMASVMRPAFSANDLQYDVQDQRNAAIFKQLIWKTRSCMNEGARAMLVQGARDSSTITTFVQNTCGGPLGSFMTQTLQRPNAEVAAFIQAMAYDELNHIPGLIVTKPAEAPPTRKPAEQLAPVAAPNPTPMQAPVVEKAPPSPQASWRPSFDCAKASTFSEKAICADTLLGKLDGALAENYKYMLASDIGDGARHDLKATQKNGLRNATNVPITNV